MSPVWRRPGGLAARYRDLLRRKAHIDGELDHGIRPSLAGSRRVRSCYETRRRAIVDEMRRLLAALPAHLREIAEGRRVGKPTLSWSNPHERLAAEASGRPVEWRA